jgi:hypothetical protein
MLRTVITTIFGTLVVMAIGGLVSANVRVVAQKHGYDQYLLRASEYIPGWSRTVIAGWPELRQRWWLWNGIIVDNCRALKWGRMGGRWRRKV